MVGEFGLPCAAPLAGVSLPGTAAHYALPQYRDGVLGWMMLMDGSDEVRVRVRVRVRVGVRVRVS